MRKRIHQKIFWYCSLGIAFMLPVWGKLVPTIIVILIINWIISGDYIRNIPLLFRDKNRRNTLLFAGLYILYVIGLLYTNNFTYAWFDLEVKLSILLFPLIFSTADVGFLNSRHIRLLMQVYLGGCVIGSSLLLGHAITLWREGVTGAFYYMKLSWYFHSAYFAMYLNFAMAFILLELLRRFKTLSTPVKTVYYLLLSWFFVFIFLLSSKMGLICMALIAVLASAHLIFRQKKTIPGLGLIILFIMLVSAGLQVFHGTSDRVEQSRETLSGTSVPETSKSTNDRIEIWKTSVDILKSNWLIGVGTGDVKDILVNKYREENLGEALELKLNAHNQYLQTFLTLGLPGIILLLLMLMLPMYASFHSHNFLYFVFLLLFLLNITVESMFETQAGVVWYAFFNMILFTGIRDPGSE